MSSAVRVIKYRVVAHLHAGIVEWTFGVELENGQRHDLLVKDGSDIPILLDLARREKALAYDADQGWLMTAPKDLGS